MNSPVTRYLPQWRHTAEDIESAFWQQWQQHQDYLYRCCMKWMSNRPDAEDALSQAMLKAWQKIQEGAGAIKNFKAWVTQLTYNLCVDLHRKRNKSAVGVESLEAIAPTDREEWASQEQTPILAATQQELEEFLRDAIDRLPPRLREPFILHLEKEQSYRDIAAALNISYDNVRKRISQARAILRQQLNEYEGKDSSTPPQEGKREKAKKATGTASVDSPKLASSDELEEAPIVASEQPETVLSVESDQPLVELQSDEKLEEIEVAIAGQPPDAALSVVQPAATLAKTELEEETGKQQHYPIDRVSILERPQQGKPEDERMSFPRQWDFSQSLSLTPNKTAIWGISSTLPRSFFLSASQFHIPYPEFIADKDDGEFMKGKIYSKPPDLSGTEGVNLYPGLRLEHVIFFAVRKTRKATPNRAEGTGAF